MDVRGERARALRLRDRSARTRRWSGQAWFDHQWGDFRVDRFVGWDWFALQLDDGPRSCST
jgi:predicted secreted hydrolase